MIPPNRTSLTVGSDVLKCVVLSHYYGVKQILTGTDNFMKKRNMAEVHKMMYIVQSEMDLYYDDV